MKVIKIKKITISVTTENNVTMQRSISGNELETLGSYSSSLNKKYLEILSELKDKQN